MGLDFEAVRAPELQGTEWFNSERPLTLGELRGKLVVLDFWTYCCINCLHVLEELKVLEHKYEGRPVVVIGVHSPKFTNEESPESVRQAVLRHGITHPVLLDKGRRTWDAYAVKGWPTLVLIDPRGYILGRVSGEGNLERLDGAIAQALDILEQAGVLDEKPLPVRLHAETPDELLTAPLLFPGKVLADEATNGLYIADTGHHRIVRTTLEGAEPLVIGSGEPGRQDGDFATARFRAPQGLALDAARNELYVADTGNHLIRRVDLASGRVTTVAGNGEIGRALAAEGPALTTPLNSPWDLSLYKGKLYIAMAGPHQIWVYDPTADTVGVFAGTGGEGRADGPIAQAAFAQPSGLTVDSSHLYVADSEISAIRVIDFEPGPSTSRDGKGSPRVKTLAGGDLFQFGDRDGRGDLARLQHPLGVAWVPVGVPGGGSVYVADTFNHKIRRLDPAVRDLTTFAGKNAPGNEDGPPLIARFREPGGLSYAKGRLYVADTNNHRIRTVELPGGTVKTLALKDVCAPGICLPG
ncbi:MAG TPA: thioredoxin-like domain-containing protein [Ktedonobacterales bacterium]